MYAFFLQKKKECDRDKQKQVTLMNASRRGRAADEVYDVWGDGGGGGGEGGGGHMRHLPGRGSRGAAVLAGKYSQKKKKSKVSIFTFSASRIFTTQGHYLLHKVCIHYAQSLETFFF
jgi:hypothetical protein